MQSGASDSIVEGPVNRLKLKKMMEDAVNQLIDKLAALVAQVIEEFQMWIMELLMMIITWHLFEDRCGELPDQCCGLC